MTGASSLSFPGSRTLASWWRQLSAIQPQALWVGYHFLHRVEALARYQRTESADPFTLLLLQAVSLPVSGTAEKPPGVSLADLDARLHLGKPIVRQVLARLVGDGLMAGESQSYGLTALGQSVLKTGRVAARGSERRTFCFLERLDPSGAREGLPYYLQVQECASMPWTAPHAFDPNLLFECPKRDEPWKDRFSFPVDISDIARGDSRDDAAGLNWQQVIFHRQEQILLALVTTAQEVQGFAAKVEGWALQRQSPILRVANEARNDVPELCPTAPPLAWFRAWESWCRSRNVPDDEIQECRVNLQTEAVLKVEGPPRLMERFRRGKSDLLKGDVWVLAGEGFIKAAAKVDFVA